MGPAQGKRAARRKRKNTQEEEARAGLDPPSSQEPAPFSGIAGKCLQKLRAPLAGLILPLVPALASEGAQPGQSCAGAGTLLHENWAYDLRSFVVHWGGSLESGHYEHYQRRGSRNWVRISDHRVCSLQDDEVAEAAPPPGAHFSSPHSGGHYSEFDPNTRVHYNTPCGRRYCDEPPPEPSPPTGRAAKGDH